MHLPYFPYSVVKFRHTGEPGGSGGEAGEAGEAGGPAGPPYRLAAELGGLEARALGEGAPVPREFANPTDGMKQKALNLLKQSHFCDPSALDLRLKPFIRFYFHLFFIFVYRHVHGGGCSGGYWLRDVSVETLHPYGPGLGKHQAKMR